MNCLIIASTVMEIAPFLQKLREGSIHSEIEVLITGIGLTSTTYALTRQIGLKRPELIIQAGVAGCFDDSFPLASVVVVKQDTIADLGVVEKKQWNSVFDLGLAKRGHAPYKKGWLVNPEKQLLRYTRLTAVNAVSVNQISTSPQSIVHYKNKFRPVVESMEGAALHFVGLMEKIPFLQLRAISNYAGERNKKKWQLEMAVINLNKELIRIVTDKRAIS